MNNWHVLWEFKNWKLLQGGTCEIWRKNEKSTILLETIHNSFQRNPHHVDEVFCLIRSFFDA